MEQLTFDVCPFCAEFSESGVASESYYHRNILPQGGAANRILLQTPRWVAVPSVGSLTAGYLLLVTKEHHPSLARCPRETLEELPTVLDRIGERYKRLYGTGLVLYEHGAVDDFITGGTSVVHTHLHCVPLNGFPMKQVEDDLSQLDSEYQREVIHHFKRLHLVRKDRPYLLIFSEGQFHIFYSDHIPSQFLRRIMAAHYNLDSQWDWKRYPFVDNMKRTLMDFEGTD